MENITSSLTQELLSNLKQLLNPEIANAISICAPDVSPNQNGMIQGTFNALGIQTGPFAACSVIFVLEIFQLLLFHTGKPILITPEGQ